MKVLLYGKNAQDLLELAHSLDLEVVSQNPQVVISYGGDGTLLSSERQFPQIPKLAIRDSKVCKKCSDHTEDQLLNALIKDRLKLQSFPKLEASLKTYKFLALNDIVIRNSTPIHAIRFQVKLNGRLIPPDIVIGDGVVAATPFGSSGYYQSITKKTFLSGFALAYNNVTVPLPPVHFGPKDRISVILIRGPANLSFDNQPHLTNLKEQDEVMIKASLRKAYIYQPELLRCRKCQLFKDQRLSQ